MSRSFAALFLGLVALGCLLLPAETGRTADVAGQLRQEIARFDKLRADPASVNRRDLWQELDGRLAKLATATNAPALRARIFYYQAWTNEELAKRSVLDKDFDKAAGLYAQAAAADARNALADHALLRRASILIETLNRPGDAKADLTRLASSRQKEIAGQAKTLLAKIASTAPPAKPTAKTSQTAPAAPPPAASPGHPAMLEAVAVAPTADGSRLTATLDRETAYRYQLLDQTRPNGEPVKRLYIDFDNTRTGSALASEKRFDAGTISRLRAGYYTPDTVRVVLELDGMQQYAIHAEAAPFRVVLDVTGNAKSADKQPSEHRAAAAPQADKDAKITAWLGNVFGADKPADPGPAPSTKKSHATASTQEARQPAAPAPLDRHPKLNFKPGKDGRKQAGNLVEQLGLTVRTVLIDPGHGGKDPGAQGLDGLVEKNVNLRFAKILGNDLTAKGFKVLYTRTTDTFIPLETRTEMANTKGADLFISIHCNSHSDRGTSGMETYSLNLANSQDAVRVAARENASSSKRISDLQAILTDLMLSAKTIESRDLARYVQKRSLDDLHGPFATRDRGPHEAPFFVLIGANMPAVLVELGYVTNPTEAKHLASDAYLRQLAKGMTDGILAYKKKIERFATL